MLTEFISGIVLILYYLVSSFQTPLISTNTLLFENNCPDGLDHLKKAKPYSNYLWLIRQTNRRRKKVTENPDTELPPNPLIFTD